MRGSNRYKYGVSSTKTIYIKPVYVMFSFSTSAAHYSPFLVTVTHSGFNQFESRRVREFGNDFKKNGAKMAALQSCGIRMHYYSTNCNTIQIWS